MRYMACKEFDSKAVIDGYQCVTTMQDLYKAIVDTEATELVIREDFATEYFTPTSLFDFITNIRLINTKLAVTSEANSVAFLDNQVKKLASIQTTEEFIYALESNNKDVFSTIRELCKFYVSAYSETLEANNKVSTQHLKIASLQRQLAEEKKKNEELNSNYHELESRLHILVSRINYQYGHNLNMEELLDASGNRYDKVLYIKEITKVHYIDTFVYYLQEILRTLYSVPCRLCVMEPFYAYDKKMLYKDLVPSWDMSADDVVNADIFMAGYQPRLIEDILKNSSNVRYLVILDRLGDMRTHVHGDNVEVLYTASDLSDMGDFQQLDRIISYSVDSLNVPYILDFDKKTNEQKMGLYSTMPTMKAVIQLMEER